jgi:soluble lytic murein transglycosylase
MVSRAWRNNGRGDPIRVGFPQVSVPVVRQQQWTIIHAITRQESQFDRQAISRAGARGLMQLMPPTARDTADKAGLTYDFDRLTSDPEYNIMLGSTFFARMLDNYGGNYVLAVAAYNAGPGNVRKWLTANGDPRMPGVDVIDWIEAIPFSETRGYVQRVLENAVVYDTLNPSTALIPKQNRLSAYLGKNNPG